jgi:hypothetical protein
LRRFLQRRIDRERSRVFGCAAPQISVNGDAVVENETFAFPETFFGWRFFEVFQNSAFELINFLETQLFHKRREFFAANSAGAEHRNPPMLARIKVLLDESRQIAELFDARIRRAAKRANLDFVIVARVENNRIFVGNYSIPIGGFSVRSESLSISTVRRSETISFLILTFAFKNGRSA